MLSERLQRRIETMLDEADAAIGESDWGLVRRRASEVLALDPDNTEAAQLLAASEKLADDNPAEAHSPVAAAAPASPASPSVAPTAEVGSTPSSFVNGRYKVLGFLGEGGKKRVYRALDTTLDREVAFSLIKAEGLDDAGRQRVTREAQAMARLGDHPALMPVFDMGQENGVPFLVQPLMTGGSVEDLIDAADGEPLPLERTMEIASQVIGGLQFAHDKRIIHRDLKPGNIWLASDGTARIGDFGLALAVDRSRLTQETMIVGTVSYMPPEQATGGEVTPRSDLYSVGAMLYEMVTGRPPFLGDDEIAIISQHVNTPPVAPRWHNAAVPIQLDSLIMRLLAKAPNERPESAADVLTVLESIDLSAVEAASASDDEDGASGSLDSMAGGVFVGRHREMDQLKGALENTLTGRGRLLMLVGEPGAGKTRTALELETYAGLRKTQVLWGRCYEDSGAPPYWPWVQAIRSYVRERDQEKLRAEMGSSASVIAEIVPDVKERLSDLQPAPVIDDVNSARFRLFDSIVSFLKSAAEAQPLLLILDDLHWADRQTLQLLEFVAAELPSSRIMILGTYRDIDLNRRHPLSLTLGELNRERLFERVILRGVSREDVGRFIELAAGVKPPDGLVEAIYNQTEGNPLFLTETVRLVIQEVDLKAENLVSTQSWSIRTPEGVKEAIGRRLDRLAERTNEVLTIASVVGRQFSLNVVEAIIDNLSEDRILDALDEALDARVIEELPSEVGRYQFTHALIRETLSSELSTTRRVRLHEQIGRTFEEIYGEDADEHAAELAFHFGEAEAIAGPERMVHFSMIAGEQALAAYAHEDAEERFTRAIGGMDDSIDARKRATAYLGLGKAEAMMFRSDEGWTNITEAFDLYLQIGDTEEAINAARAVLPGGGMRGMDVFNRALELVEPESEAGVDLLARRARCRYSQEHDEARRDITEALRLAEKVADEKLQAYCSAVACSIYGMVGKWSETLSHSLNAIEHGRASGQTLPRVLGHLWAANCCAATGLSEEGDEHNQQAYDLGGATQNKGQISSALSGFSRNTVMRGDYEDADRYLAEGLGELPDDQLLLNMKFRLDIERGNFDSIEDAEKNPDNFHLWTANLNGLVALATGSDRHATVARNEFDALFPDGIQNVDSWGVHNNAWVILPIIENDADGAKLRLEQMGWWSGWMSHHALCGDRLLGLLSQTAGQIERAAEYFESALTFCRDAGYRPEQAWTALNYSELLAGSDGARSSALQNEAMEIGQQVGMKPLIERILASRKQLDA